MVRDASFRRRAAPRLAMNSALSSGDEDVPKVDVFITCCNEDHNMILNTVRAACALEWPAERLRIFVLDDGKSAALAHAIDGERRRHPNVIYTSRPQPRIPDFKAGNLNHGLEVSGSSSEESAPFIAGLDADMIVRPHWLRVAIPHLILNPKLAMVCFPQVLSQSCQLLTPKLTTSRKGLLQPPVL